MLQARHAVAVVDLDYADLVDDIRASIDQHELINTTFVSNYSLEVRGYIRLNTPEDTPYGTP